MDDPDAFDDAAETEATHLQRSVPITVLTLRAEGQDHRMQMERAWTVGSAAEADVGVGHPTTSRLHARIEPRGGEAWVVDLGSTNGTFVDGVRVDAAQLRDGCSLHLGDAACRVGFSDSTARLWPTHRFGPLIGQSGVMRALFDYLQKVSESDATALIQGETGTGKDVVARAIHEASPRAGGPFVVFDCAAMPEALFESELFGYARGAFTGADRSRDGAAQAADGGVLFLDEVGELPLSVQPKLLRVLETRTVRKVGEAAHKPVDIRLLAATHRDLARMVGRGEFREDLYFRLVVLPVHVPPLRERSEDLGLLIEHFSGRPADPAMLAEAVARSWPGNVRELRTFVERATALGTHAALQLADGDQPIRETGRRSVDLDRTLREVRAAASDRVERLYLEGWLERTGRNVTAVAERIGLDRSYVHRLMRKHGL